MPLLMLVLLVGVLAYMWFTRRHSTLTRECLWRQDRTAGANVWRCAACGAVADMPGGKPPRHCGQR